MLHCSSCQERMGQTLLFVSGEMDALIAELRWEPPFAPTVCCGNVMLGASCETCKYSEHTTARPSLRD